MVMRLQSAAWLVGPLTLFCLAAPCWGQGTMTIGFEGPAIPGGPYPSRREPTPLFQAI